MDDPSCVSTAGMCIYTACSAEASLLGSASMAVALMLHYVLHGAQASPHCEEYLGCIHPKVSSLGTRSMSWDVHPEVMVQPIWSIDPQGLTMGSTYSPCVLPVGIPTESTQCSYSSSY